MKIPLALSFLGAYIIFRKGQLTLLASCLIVSVESSADETMPTIQFSIKPRLCVLSEGEEICRDELEIKWVSRWRRSLCLHRSDSDAPIKCWENRFSGDHDLEISASRNVDFHLKEQTHENPLASEAFEVVHDNTKYRRRRRNAWSFF